MKTISASVDTQYGTEPIIVVSIEWESGTILYGERVLETVKGDILEINGINNLNREDRHGELSTVSIVLNDTDGTLKTINDTDIIEGTRCKIYQVYQENDAMTESNLIMVGRIIGEVVWSEGERTLSFNIETPTQDGEIGYTPNAGDFADLDKDAAGKMWPICFGKPLRVPAVRVYKRLHGTCKSVFTYASTTCIVEGGLEFPQSTSISIRIGGIKCTGSMVGNTFTPTSINEAIYTTLAVAARGGDQDATNGSVLWLNSTSKYIVGHYCMYNHPTLGKMVNYCINQVGTKCYFQKPWRRAGVNESILLASVNINETALYPRTSWGLGYQYEMFFTEDWLTSKSYPYTGTVINVDEWTIAPDSVVTYDSGKPDTYVINNMVTTSVLEVMAYRKIKENGIDTRRLVSVPSRWYTKNLNTTINSQTCSIITFPVGLDDPYGKFKDYDFEGDLFVSMESSQHNNVSDIIKYIIEGYSDITVDTISFGSVHTACVNYPCNFALLSSGNAIEIASKIAWQARCLLYIRDGIAYLKYLSSTPSSTVMTLDADSILVKSIQLTYNTIENLITSFTAKWSTDHSGEESTKKTYIKTNNVDKFGLKKQEYDFNIYNIESLVKISADFWSNRYSNIWKNIKCNCVLESIKLDAFDDITFDQSTIISNHIRGDVLKINYNRENLRVQLDLQLACQGGTVTEDTSYWDIGSHSMPTDPSDGLAEVDYIPTNYNEGNNTSKDKDKPKEEYFIRIRKINKVTRGTAFRIKVTLENIGGSIVSKDMQVALVFKSTDSNDVINATYINLVNGIGYANLTITTGTGEDMGVIGLYPYENTKIYHSTESNAFPIVSEVDIEVTNYPNKVTRGQAFEVSGTGPTNHTFDIVWISYVNMDDEVSPTTVTSDADGNWSASLTISGGEDESNGILEFYKDAHVGYTGLIEISDEPDNELDIKAGDYIDIVKDINDGKMEVSVDLTEVDGYDPDKLQVLVNNNGTLEWQDTEECT